MGSKGTTRALQSRWQCQCHSASGSGTALRGGSDPGVAVNCNRARVTPSKRAGSAHTVHACLLRVKCTWLVASLNHHTHSIIHHSIRFHNKDASPPRGARARTVTHGRGRPRGRGLAIGSCSLLRMHVHAHCMQLRNRRSMQLHFQSLTKTPPADSVAGAPPEVRHG